MTLNRRSCWIGILLIASAATAQELAQIEKELKARYKHQPLIVNLSIASGKLTYDLKGEPVGTFLQTCTMPQLKVKKVKVTDQEVVFHARGATRQVIAHRGSTPLPADAKERDVVVRIRSDGQQWDLARIDAVLEAISKRLSLRPNPASVSELPKGAERPVPGSDPRIAFMLPSGPVYRVRDGVSQPKALEMPDPDYTDAARKARIMGVVEYRLVLNEDGVPSYIRLNSAPLGYGLDASAAQTLAQWRFRPAILDGRPVKVDLAVQTSFCLY